jgi:hypothetical protein
MKTALRLAIYGLGPLAILMAPSLSRAQAIITTVAGGGSGPGSGDGGPATRLGHYKAIRARQTAHVNKRFGMLTIHGSYRDIVWRRPDAQPMDDSYSISALRRKSFPAGT